MIWYKRVLEDYSRGTVVSIGLTMFCLFIMAAIQLVNGRVFEWTNITPIDTPDIWVRLLYSALTYVSIGALLYYIRFYQFLSMLYGRNRRGYRDAKGIIWSALILLMFFVIVPTGVDVLNTVISFFYNILLFLVYVSPVILLAFLAIVRF